MIRKVINSKLLDTLKSTSNDISSLNWLAHLNTIPIPFDLFGDEAKDYMQDRSPDSIYLPDGRMGFHVYNDFCLVVCCSQFRRSSSFYIGNKQQTKNDADATVEACIGCYSKNKDGNWRFRQPLCLYTGIDYRVQFKTSDFKTNNEKKLKQAMNNWISKRKRAAADCVNMMGKMVLNFPKNEESISDFIKKFR